MSLGLQVPEDGSIGPTTQVVVTAPSSFAVRGCTAPPGWGCSVEGRRVTYTNAGLSTPSVFGLSVTTAPTPGTYAFPVTQRDAEGGAVTWSGGDAPTVTVRGAAQEPPPAEPTPTPAPSPSPAPSGGGSSGGTGTSGSNDTGSGSGSGSGGSSTTPAPSSSSAPSATSDPAEDQTDDDASSSGSTSPTRTQGRTSGSTLEISPGAPEEAPRAAEPAVAAPDVAAPPSKRSDDADTVTVAAGDSGRSLPDIPWQQWLGGALLLAGGATLAVRRFRSS